FARLRRGVAYQTGSVRLAGIVRVRVVMNAIGMDVAPIADVDGAISGAFELSNSLDEPALRVWIDGANWRRGDDQLGSFALDARVLRENGAGIIVVDRLDAVGIDRLPDGPLDPATGRPRLPLADPSVDRVRASGRAQLEPLLIEDSYLEAVIHDLSRYEWLARLIWPGTTPRLRGQVEASVLGNGEPDTWRGDVWLAARHLRLFDHDLGELTLDGVAAPHQLFVNRVSLDGPAGRMTLAGSVDWSGIRGTDRDTLGIALRAFAIERRDDRLALADPAQLRVHFTKARASGITFGNELRLAGTIGRINARGRLHLQNGESDFALGVRELRLPALRRLLEPDAPPLHVNEPIDRVDLVVSGPADNALWELRVATGALRVRESPLLVALREFGAGEGDAPPTTTDRSDPQLDGLIWITGTGSRALVRDARVRLFAVDPSGASQLLASATASGTLPLDPLSVLQSALANDNARWLDRLLASGSLALRLQLQCDDLLALHRLGARLPLPGGRLSVDCGVSGTWRQPGAALVATSPALDCAPIGAEQLAAIDRAAGTHFADVAARPASLVLGLDLRAAYGPRATPPDEPRTPGTLGELRLDELTLTGDEHIGRISLAGALHTRGSLVGALAGREPIDLIDARLHVRGALPSLARLPLPWGAQPAIDAGVEIDLQATSLMHHPRWNGFVVVRDGRLDAGGIMPPLERIEGRIDFAGEDVRVSDARLTAGSGLVEMAGTLLLAPDPERVRIHLRAVGRNVLVARDDSMNLRANLDLSVGGSFDAPVVSGRVAITRGEFHRPLDTFNLLQSISRAPAVAGGWRVPFVGDPRLDVQVTSLAAARIRTPNTIAEASASLRVLGTANEVRLDGRIDVARMYISLPATTLHIDSGGLVFHQSADSDRSGPPQIWLNGRSTVRGYRIVLAVSGPAGQPALELSSVPPLPADQLLVMLFTGDAPRAVDTLKGADLAGAEKVSVFIGPDVLRRVFGADPQVREQMLDRIDVQPDVDISESGESMFVVRFALAGNLVSRSDRVEVELSRDRYDDFNTGLTFTLRFR
ncbi:MAG: translocation/assembly module TamB domain-containing protein, partial [Planctomycetota bacterium]